MLGDCRIPFRGDSMSNRDRTRAALSRRPFLKNSALASGVLAGRAPRMQVLPQGALKQASMMMDWIYQGPNVGFMLARDKGFYREAGLDVTLTPGKGSGRTAQLIA